MLQNVKQTWQPKKYFTEILTEHTGMFDEIRKCKENDFQLSICESQHIFVFAWHDNHLSTQTTYIKILVEYREN